jgi:hypothetical protein
MKNNPQGWPIIDNVVAPLADWWRRHAETRENVAELEGFDAGEMARMAQDIGIPASDLRELARHCTDAANLLDRRLDNFGLTKAELAQTAPAQLRDMERLCTLCISKGRCARDLATDPSDPVWRQYCPNEETIVALAREGLER